MSEEKPSSPTLKDVMGEFYECTICGMYYLEFIDIEPRVCGTCLHRGSESNE